MTDLKRCEHLYVPDAKCNRRQHGRHSTSVVHQTLKSVARRRNAHIKTISKTTSTSTTTAVSQSNQRQSGRSHRGIPVHIGWQQHRHYDIDSTPSANATETVSDDPPQLVQQLLQSMIRVRSMPHRTTLWSSFRPMWTFLFLFQQCGSCGRHTQWLLYQQNPNPARSACTCVNETKTLQTLH